MPQRNYIQSAMTTLVKDCTAARLSRNGYLEHPATVEIYRRLPPDLRPWFATVIYEREDPLALRCGPRDRSDEGYFEIWRMKRDRDDPELHPDYRPPEDDDGGDGDAGAPFAPM